ncbi:dihydroxyacetone kinase subunit DhaL [Methylobacter sp. BBA5.1]|jgi:phosphoenolpyruvate---glycerone phosphotransferase subunit DhaL|uniref:dihydroxyacetone kinase subunit DhaL n=1 Tax=Methylobacter sp. BBA5.1 TaxID=1495064 RepID=UPI00055AE24B|nr:dihydroxyacetone kinase subunit DhaL [Methylobacter sp. BBA5.1]
MAILELSAQDVRKMFLYVSQRMVESKDLLTQADKAIGDGDHGVGMARGFGAVAEKLEGQSFNTVGELLKTIGTTLLMSVGGAAGAVFGTFFSGGAKNLGDAPSLDSRVLSHILLDGLEAVKQRGGAKVGDKTMVDALQSAAMKSEDMSSAPLSESLSAVAGAAEQGMEKTKEMTASIGKAKTLGERSLGHADPGAISTYLILKFMTEFVTERDAPR